MPTDTIQPIQDLLNRWILIGQALVGSVGALAFVVAFLWRNAPLGETPNPIRRVLGPAAAARLPP